MWPKRAWNSGKGFNFQSRWAAASVTLAAEGEKLIAQTGYQQSARCFFESATGRLQTFMVLHSTGRRKEKNCRNQGSKLRLP
jgi:hypothetical protein